MYKLKNSFLPFIKRFNKIKKDCNQAQPENIVLHFWSSPLRHSIYYKRPQMKIYASYSHIIYASYAISKMK